MVRKAYIEALRNRIFRLIGCILMILIAAATVEAAAITYTDKMGRVVTVPVPVKRAIFFQSYEFIPALGTWDKVVGISRYAYDNDLIKATRHDIERSILSVGTDNDVNMESLLKLKPDIVIISSSKPEIVRFIEKHGLNVIVICPESLAELYDVMRLCGMLFGREEKMDRAISEMDKIFSMISKRVSKVPPDQKQKTLLIGGKPTSVACGVGINNKMFQMMGGINSAGGIRQKNADVSMEHIIVWNPDIIFIDGSHAGYTAQDILHNPQWRYIKAIKEGRVYKKPKWSNWSPRLAPIVLWMAMKTYPKYFRDIYLDKVTDDFYRKVYGMPYSKMKKYE